MTARIARFLPPGKWWYFAACTECRWSGLPWRDKGQAVLDRNDHNNLKHGTNARPTCVWPLPGPARLVSVPPVDTLDREACDPSNEPMQSASRSSDA